jgi:putative membrane-bound dehydrogenase-like protein
VEAWKDSGALKPGHYDREPQDRVSILSDTDGDGVMDKKTVFADKIELATSSVFYTNGIIVCAAPDIWFFEDTDGDDKADKRTKLYTNLGIRDTHAVINNRRWGLDGWIYATHGYSSSDDVTSGDGSKHFGAIGAGVVRFRPDGSAIEQYASRGGNTWGLDITWDGQVFYTQPTSGNHFIHVVLPEYVLAKGKLPGVMGTNDMLPREPTYSALHTEHQDQEPELGAGRAQLAQGLEPSHHRHRDVEQHDVGGHVTQGGDGLDAVGGFAHHLDVLGLAQDANDGATREVVIVDHHDADRSVAVAFRGGRPT